MKTKDEIVRKCIKWKVYKVKKFVKFIKFVKFVKLKVFVEANKFVNPSICQFVNCFTSYSEKTLIIFRRLE